ncbi:30S ribosomal protein S1, partial [candidate division KSB1 bacterium]
MPNSEEIKQNQEPEEVQKTEETGKEEKPVEEVKPAEEEKPVEDVKPDDEEKAEDAEVSGEEKEEIPETEVEEEKTEEQAEDENIAVEEKKPDIEKDKDLKREEKAEEVSEEEKVDTQEKDEKKKKAEKKDKEEEEKDGKKETEETEIKTAAGFKVDKAHYKKLEDVKEEEEYSEEERDVLTKLYDQTISEFKEGEILQGKIITIDDKEIVVDIGFKSEGTIPVDEFDSTEELHIGDEIEVYLDNIEDKDGQMVLSKKKADFTRTWQKIMEMYENDTVFLGKCLRRIKGGMVVDLMGIDAFLPGSQIDVKPIRDFDALISKEMEFKIVKVNELRKNIVVSRRVIIEEGLKEQRGKIIEELEKGQIREGVVKNITDFGVFIDLGGVDGLLHITDLSWGRVNHPSEVVQFDQKINVMILDFDENKERISLGLKQMLPHPWEDIESKYPVGSKVKGKVVSLTDYGAFVEIEKGIEGLIHISEMSWTEHIKHPSKVLSLGDEVEATILSIEKAERKISLGLKQNEPDPWDLVEKKYPVGAKHEGIVRNITNFGVFVELEEGIDGLVHISDLSWTKKIRHPGEVVKKGDQINVVVMDISREERKISLGHKQIDENPWDKFEKEYSVGAYTDSEIVRVMDKGIIVNLPLNVEGFVPTSQIDLKDGKLTETFKPGDKVNLKIIEFEKASKKIVLSHSAFIKEQENAEVQEFLNKQKKELETLGELKQLKEKASKAVEKEPEEEPKKKKEKKEKKVEPKEKKVETDEKPEETVEEPVEAEKKDEPKKTTKKKTAKKTVKKSEEKEDKPEKDEKAEEKKEKKTAKKKTTAIKLSGFSLTVF